MSPETKKILIVEDTDSLRFLMKKILIKEGYSVLEASNGEEAMKVLSMNSDIGLILLDMMMPKVNGLDFLKKSHNLKKESLFKVCMLTSKWQEQDIKECLINGADDYMIKPMDKGLLLEKIKILLEEDSADNFMRLTTTIKAQILRESSSIEIVITQLSESEIIFTSDIELPLSARVQIKSDMLFKLLGIEKSLLLRVYKVEKDGAKYFCSGSFVGLREEVTKKIRVITMRGEEIHE